MKWSPYVEVLRQEESYSGRQLDRVSKIVVRSIIGGQDLRLCNQSVQFEDIREQGLVSCNFHESILVPPKEVSNHHSLGEFRFQ